MENKYDYSDHRLLPASPSIYKKGAREALKGRYIEAVFAYAIYFAMTSCVSLYLSFYPNNKYNAAAVLYSWLLFGPTVVGMCAYYVKSVRYQDPLQDHIRILYAFANKLYQSGVQPSNDPC